MTTHVKGNTETTRNSSKAKRHYKVTAVDEKTGDADLELSIDWVHMQASFEKPDGLKPEPIVFQSDDPEKQPKEFQDVQQTIGKPRATIRFNPAGMPIKVIQSALPPSPPPAVNTPPANPAATGPSSPPIHDTTPENFLLPLPEQPVAVGETWKDRFVIVLRDNNKNLNRIIIQQSYKLVDVKNGLAVIEFRTAVLTPVQNPAVLGQLIQREIIGKAVFDLARGLVIARESGVDNTVVGPFGPQSSMKAKSQYREKVIDDAAQAGPEGSAPAAVTAKKE